MGMRLSPLWGWFKVEPGTKPIKQTKTPVCLLEGAFFWGLVLGETEKRQHTRVDNMTSRDEAHIDTRLRKSQRKQPRHAVLQRADLYQRFRYA